MKHKIRINIIKYITSVLWMFMQVLYSLFLFFVSATTNTWWDPIFAYAAVAGILAVLTNLIYGISNKKIMDVILKIVLIINICLLIVTGVLDFRFLTYWNLIPVVVVVMQAFILKWLFNTNKRTHHEKIST